MSKTNPKNPYLDAYIEAWGRYTEAYHSDAGILEQQTLLKEYKTAHQDYKNNPQTILNES